MSLEGLPGDEPQIEFTASKEVWRVLEDLGRTEDVKFSPDNRRLAVAGFAKSKLVILVADAGAPYVNVYAKDGDSWKGIRDPVTSFRVMDEMMYRRGRRNPQEGGPKGIDIDSDMNVLVTTSDEQVLAFFDLPQILKKRGIPMDWRKKSVQWRVERIRADLRRLRGWK
jgi:hypothetical protein